MSATDRSTAWRASSFLQPVVGGQRGLGRQLLALRQHLAEPPVLERGLHAADHGLGAGIVGGVSGLAHPHDRAGAGHQAVEHGGIGRLGLRIDGSVGDAAEILGESGQRRRAFQAVALQWREIERRAGSLAHGVELGARSGRRGPWRA